MKLYALLDRLFPLSFTAKVFTLAFVGIHVPLIVMVGYVLVTSGMLATRVEDLLVLLLATLAGTVGTLAALRAVLSPLFQIDETLRTFESQGSAPLLPSRYRDEIGRLMMRSNRLVLAMGQRLQQTQEEADTDPLTGLLNRRGFARRLNDQVRGALIHLDVDRFKAVNDTLGHEAGDEVLREVAEAIRGALRNGDIPARHGGEEFVIFLPGVPEFTAEVVAERVRSAVESRVRVSGRPITVSLGVSMAHDPRPLKEMLAEADSATLSAKKAGRNRVIRWSQIAAA
ncbi:MAG: hypothetical protein A2092_13375 [Rhodobacteraceae bacterium GWE1_64_9]|nr:MAG: hypothetical protein A2092_13375 [Rhodobacteraceae bacterium GWE1_64_9]OHC49754.1 MAG: hypothetical protein A2X69_05930 [Rhodobacteraceae bacterium GWF1_65_7]